MSKRKRPTGAKRILTWECLICGRSFDIITWAIGQQREPTGHRHCPQCGQPVEMPRPQAISPFTPYPGFGGLPNANDQAGSN